MRAHPLPEAQTYAQLMLDELRKVIPSFLVRVDRPDRGGAWIGVPRARPATTPPTSSHAPLRSRRARARRRGHAARLGSRRRRQGARGDLLPAHATCRRRSCSTGCAGLPADDRVALMHAYVGDRTNRRHKPGRAFERTGYRFDVLGDYGAFRDLQRHRMLTIEWQQLTPHHGYEVPDAGARRRARDALRRRDGALGRAVRRARRPLPGASRVRGVARVPHALRDADERARSDAPLRAAQLAARSSDAIAASRRRCTG